MKTKVQLPVLNSSNLQSANLNLLMRLTMDERVVPFLFCRNFGMQNHLLREKFRDPIQVYGKNGENMDREYTQ